MKGPTTLVTAIFVIAVICGLSVTAGAEQIRFKVSAPKVDSFNLPVRTVIEELSEPLDTLPVEAISVELRDQGTDKIVPGQLVVTDWGALELWWILPRAKANSASIWIATIKRDQNTSKEGFSWKCNDGKCLDLLFNSRKVARYMYSFGASNPQRVFETYKPFLHVFDAEGENLLTNGPDGIGLYQKQKILYPHHRGIFIGWTKLECAGNTFNFWGMAGGVVQRHCKFLEQTAGPVLARSKVLIYWNDKDSRPIIAERRQMTVFRQSDPAILLLDFQTRLKAVRGEVFLNGDPEHGGFQYRAHNDVATGGQEVKATYLFHKDGIDARKDKDLPWTAMSYGLNGRRYCVQHMNHPDNPKPTFYSAYRDYGRFGSFFKQKIDAGETLTLRYRIWIGEGKMRRRQEFANRYSAFAQSLKVEMLKK